MANQGIFQNPYALILTHQHIKKKKTWKVDKYSAETLPQDSHPQKKEKKPSGQRLSVSSL